MNEMWELVRQRRSIRHFRPELLTEAEVEQIETLLNSIEQLNEELEMDFELLEQADFKKFFKMTLPISAPHYLVIGCQRGEDYLQNCGHFGETLILHLTALGIATCWLGSVAPRMHYRLAQPYAITIALGHSDEPWRSAEENIKRKPVAEFCPDCTADVQCLLERARLAPSAMNNQPWQVVQEGAQLVICRKKPGAFSLTKNLQMIDIGIFIATIQALAPEYTATFVPDTPAPEGFIYEYTLIKQDGLV